MSISIRLDENQRSLLQLTLEIARDKFKENVRGLGIEVNEQSNPQPFRAVPRTSQ